MCMFQKEQWLEYIGAFSLDLIRSLLSYSGCRANPPTPLEANPGYHRLLQRIASGWKFQHCTSTYLDNTSVYRKQTVLNDYGFSILRIKSYK